VVVVNAATAIDRRLLCQCRASAPPDGTPDLLECQYRATGEDMLCDTCRAGCTTAAYLAAEDTTVHLGPDARIDWDDLDGASS